MYNKSEIMKNAWNYFNGKWENKELGSFPTFSQSLKFAWKEAKEVAIQKQEQVENAKNSEEVKAFNWAQKKLQVEFDMTDVQKQNAVISADQKQWTSNVWKAAISAVKMEITSDVYVRVA